MEFYMQEPPQNLPAFVVAGAHGEHHTAILEQVEAVSKESDLALFPVVGNCLEAAGVEDGGFVAVDFTHYPAPPRNSSNGRRDLCLCFGTYPGHRRAGLMLKAYAGVWGNRQMVESMYPLLDGKRHMNCTMTVERILGVVFASWSKDGQLLWKRAPASFPDKLNTRATIQGDNIGDPMDIES